MISTEKRKISFKAQKNKIVEAENQLAILNGDIFSSGELIKFSDKLKETGALPFFPKKLEIFQINIGYMCNQVCEHCHVDAGPDRKEIMTKEVMQDCLNAITLANVHTVDITGGAPEMNPNFRWFIEELTKINIKDIIVRSNLTIIVSNPKYYDLPEFFRKHNIHVVSSLPCYTQENVDKQRGEGVFSDSIRALKMLNSVGYGSDHSGLLLDLVYNPGGPSISGNQQALENDYKKQLKENFGINFNNLFTITNLPISRFLDFLLVSNRFEEYMGKLITSFNPYTLDNVMCKNTISVDWEGWIYDCDFNQILHLKNASSVKNVKDFNEQELQKREIIVSQHCYGCTAGEGSSCQGAIV